MTQFARISSVQAGKGADQIEHCCRRMWMRGMGEQYAELASVIREQRDALPWAVRVREGLVSPGNRFPR